MQADICDCAPKRAHFLFNGGNHVLDDIRIAQIACTGPDSLLTIGLCQAGGFLLQDRDLASSTSGDCQVVTRNEPTPAQIDDLLFAEKVGKHVKSNTIVLAKGGRVTGVGAGQMSRVDSVKIAVDKAGEHAAGSVLASDAFFPFPDGVEAALDAGITALLQPGGSRRDEDVIAACDAREAPMVFTGARHFRH